MYIRVTSLYIEGRIRYTTYDDKQGQRRYATEIWADNMEPAFTETCWQCWYDKLVNEPVSAPQPDNKPDEVLPF